MRQFRHYILEKDGRSLYKAAGIVSATNNRVRLPHAPVDFTKMSIAWERDMQKIGILRNVTAPLGFIGEAYDILCDQFYKGNIERELFMLITRHRLITTDTTYQHYYKFFYKAQFDFTTWQDDGTLVKLKLDEGGISRKLKANSSTVYEIPVDDCDYEMVKHDGFYMQLTQRYIIPAGNTNNTHLIGISQTVKEGESGSFVAFDVFQEIAGSIDYTTDTRYFFTTTSAISGVRIYGSIAVGLVPAVSSTYKAQIKTSAGRTFDVITDITGSGAPFDITIDTLAGEKFFLVGFAASGSAPITGAVYTETDVTIELNSRYPTTYVKVVRASELFRKLVYYMTGSEENCDTSFVENFDNIVLLPGDANRGLPNAVFKTSFDKFFQFCKVVMATGLGVVKDKVVINEYPYFLKTTNPIRIPAIKDLQVETAFDLMFNTLKIGWAVKDIDEANGRYAFNNTHVYQTPIEAIKKELNLTCDYIADPYVIENHRLNLEGKTTTDSSEDNDVFVLDTVKAATLERFTVKFNSGDQPNILITNTDTDLFQAGLRFDVKGSANNDTTLTVVGTLKVPIVNNLVIFTAEQVIDEEVTVDITPLYRTLNRPVYDSIEGIPDITKDTIYNLELNPANLMQRHIRWFNSVLYHFSGQYLKFLTTERNRDIKTVKSSPIMAGTYTMDADADIPIGSDRIFIPFYIDVDTQEPADLIESLDEDPNRAMIMGDGVAGFIIKAGIQPAEPEEQSYKLLLSPDVDLLNIHKNAYQ